MVLCILSRESFGQIEYKLEKCKSSMWHPEDIVSAFIKLSIIIVSVRLKEKQVYNCVCPIMSKVISVEFELWIW